MLVIYNRSNRLTITTLHKQNAKLGQSGHVLNVKTTDFASFYENSCNRSRVLENVHLNKTPI